MPAPIFDAQGTTIKTHASSILITSALLLIFGCTTRPVSREVSAPLHEAVTLFIDGNLEEASTRLRKLSRELDSDEELRTVYLYLGRCHMGLGDYEGAVAAFSAGKVLGGDVQFDTLLNEARHHLIASPETISTQTSITRAQFAALVDQIVLTPLGNADEFTPGDLGFTDDASGEDVSDHWAKAHIENVRRAGFMEVLPDGRFHPDAGLTRTSFYVEVTRMAAALGVSPDVMEDWFEGGFRRVVATGATRQIVVSGREARQILEALSSAAEG